MSVATEEVVAAARAAPADASAVIRHRMRLLVGCVLLLTVCFLQDPGLIVADTKLDLAVAPLRFLARALHLWDPGHDFGRLQDQALGYAFPIGPFFALGHIVGLPVWVVQRLWMATLLVTAFLGASRVASRLGVRGSWPVVLSAGLYVVAPRAMSLISTDSAEILPWALMPWTLVALMPKSGRIGRREVGRSAIAVVLMGGINAAAVVAVLPAAALWLLTRRWSTQLLRVAGLWVVAVSLGVAWWLLPLFLEARYGFNFLGFTESAAATTSHSGPGEALRGVADWVGYLGIGGLPWWRAGWWLSTDGVAAVFTAVVVAAGAAGLALKSVPHRRFLLLCLAGGLAFVTFGHLGELAPAWAPTFHHLLDGPLAPLRNTHKFDPMIRLPLAVGLGHLLARARVVLPGRPEVDAQRIVAVGAAAVLLVVAVPAMQGNLPSRGSFAAVPDYWQQAATWLDRHAGPSTTLGLPAAGFAEYNWGRPLDDPLGVLAASATVSRTLIPLGSTGETRVLDAVESVVGVGRTSPGLAPFLRRAGVRYVLVRNDLSRYETGAPWPVLVHASLAGSPGLRRVAFFGPTVGPVFSGAATLQYSGDLGLDVPFPALEVFEVEGATGPVSAYPAETAVALSGGPESLLQLADAGVLAGAGSGDRATVLSGDATPALGLKGTWVTDGLRRRELNFGLVRDNASATLGPGDPFRLPAPVHDYLPLEGVAHQTVGGLTEGARVAASSSASDASVLGFVRGPQFQPANAFDTDPATVWLASPDQQVVGQWVRLDLAHAVDTSVVAVRLASYPQQPTVTRLRITTDAGAVVVAPKPGDGVQVFRVPSGSTRSLELRVDAVSGQHPVGTVVGVVDVSLPGVHPQRTISPPADTAVSGPQSFVFGTAPGARGACVPAAELIVCQPLLAAPGEEARLDRTFVVRSGEDVALTGTVTPRGGPKLDSLVAAHRDSPEVSATSSLVDEPQGDAAAAVDGDVRTSWIAAEGTGAAMTVSWPTPRRISSLEFVVPAGLPVSPPEVVHVHSAAGDRDGLVSATGQVQIQPFTARSITVSFPRTFQRYSASADQAAVPLPVGFAELRVNGEANPSAPSGTEVLVPCGEGPTVTLDGQSLETSVTGTLGDLVAMRPLALTVCSGLQQFAAGTHRLSSGASGALWVTGLVAQPQVAWPQGSADLPAQPIGWGADQREVRLPQGSGTAGSYLVVHENFNQGWVATAGGRTLTAVRIDGWQQGWRVPAGVTVVKLRFTPQRTFVAALVAGVVCLLVLLALAFVPPQRSSRSGRSGLPWAQGPSRAQAYAEFALATALVVLVGGGWGAAAVGFALLARGVLGRWPVLPLVAAGAAGVTAWSALPTVTPPGSVPLGAAAAASSAGGLVVLAVLVAAAAPDWRRRRAHAVRPANEEVEAQ